jgi:hypothetical protein
MGRNARPWRAKATRISEPRDDRWLGIDFSGNHLKWRPNCTTSNVWVADVRRWDDEGSHRLHDVRRVQRLEIAGSPFDRLAALLSTGAYIAAGIDASFSVQLCAWELPDQRYDGPMQTAVATRTAIVRALSVRVSLGSWSSTVLASANARDSVLSAFAAVGTSKGGAHTTPSRALSCRPLVSDAPRRMSGSWQT